jgi:hypothetical protein
MIAARPPPWPSASAPAPTPAAATVITAPAASPITVRRFMTRSSSVRNLAGSPILLGPPVEEHGGGALTGFLADVKFREADFGGLRRGR